VIDSPPKILVIKSDISKLVKVQSFVNEIFVQYNISHEYFNRVFLCVSEAVVNSIEHGNKNDTNKEVSIVVDCKLKSLFVKIIDEGEGFNLDEVADPTKGENIKKEFGRGIHIIKSLSEHIEYNQKENSFQFKIECK